MIILITGATHTGKTMLAQQLLTTYKYPYLSIDWLKMGLIRSGNTSLTPEEDANLEEYLWPIIREIIKTAIENEQNLIVEGGYVPLSWKNEFGSRYVENIKFYCLIMSKNYIENYYDIIIQKENIIENRQDVTQCAKEILLSENSYYLDGCIKNKCNYVLIDSDYDVLSNIII